MKRYEEDAGIVVEHILRSVAMVHVPIDDHDPLKTVNTLGVASSDGDIIE